MESFDDLMNLPMNIRDKLKQDLHEFRRMKWRHKLKRNNMFRDILRKQIEKEYIKKIYHRESSEVTRTTDGSYIVKPFYTTVNTAPYSWMKYVVYLQGSNFFVVNKCMKQLASNQLSELVLV